MQRSLSITGRSLAPRPGGDRCRPIAWFRLQSQNYNASASLHSKSSQTVSERSQALARNETLKSTLGKKTEAILPRSIKADAAPLASSDTAAAAAKTLYQQKIQHGALQSALAFVTVLISAQSMKNAQEKRKLERERNELLTDLEETRLALQSVTQNPLATRLLAKECYHVIRESDDFMDQTDVSSRAKSRHWSLWNRLTAKSLVSANEAADEDEDEDETNDMHDNNHSNDDNPDRNSNAIGRLTRLLQDDLQRRAGKAGLTHEQLDQLQLNELLQQANQSKQEKQSQQYDANEQSGGKIYDDGSETNALLERLLQESQDESSSTTNNEATNDEGRKRTVYSF
jgi:hypothetical protein